MQLFRFSVAWLFNAARWWKSGMFPFGLDAHRLGERLGQLVERDALRGFGSFGRLGHVPNSSLIIQHSSFADHHRLATSAFMNFNPSAASCFSLRYIRRQILVAGTSLSNARPNASMTSRPS